MNQGLVSTIVPVYNRPRLLSEAVRSVLQQTYRSIEIVIVDDGSTDATADVADTLSREAIIPVKVIRQVNSGPGAARQRGLDEARGEFIQFLDSDDLLLPAKFSAQVATLQRRPECGICYGPSAEENHASNPPGRDCPMRATGELIDHLFPRLLTERWWTTSSPLYRRTLLDQIGPWQPWINEEDWEYDARCGATRTRLAWVEDPCSVRRINLGNDHLSQRGSVDPRKLSDRSMARQSIYISARQAGIPLEAPEMRLFARSTFLLCRQCGLAGLDKESITLLNLARCASTPTSFRLLYYFFYGLVAHWFGWRRGAKFANIFSPLTHSTTSRASLIWLSIITSQR